MVKILAKEIDQLLAQQGHTRDDIICVLWGEQTSSSEADLSIDLESFWKYAENMTYDYEIDWVTGPNYPMYLLSGKGWWIETGEYDSRTFLVYQEEPKFKAVTNSISENGAIRAPQPKGE